MNLSEKITSHKTLSITIALLFIFYCIHFLNSRPKPLSIPLPQVVTQKPSLRDIREYISQTGTTVAYNSVNLVARVEGYLDSIEFTDGSFVKKGQLLFIIQPQTYLEQLKAAQATVKAQQAALVYAKSEYARQERMYKQNATSLNEVEKWSARTQEYSAEIAKAQADEVVAQINYGYTHVLAPFDGRIGRHLVDVGNLVGNGQATNLATIEQIHPLYVYFNLNEIDLIKLRQAAREQGLTAKDLHQIPVDISLQNNPNLQIKATLDFVNTGLNASTGTMELRAILANQDHRLVPGLFVQVRVAISPEKKQLTVPDTAVLYDQIGPYLYTVNQNQVVMIKRVSLGGLEQGFRAITQGLTAADEVIIDGLQFATPGNKVSPKPQ